jgi:hypothetical protein
MCSRLVTSFSCGNPEAKRPIGISGLWADNIKLGLKEMGLADVNVNWLIGIRPGTCSVSCDRDREPSGRMKAWELSVVDRLIASEGRLCCSTVFVKSFDAR